MRNRIKMVSIIFTVSAALIVSACAETNTATTNSWIDPSYKSSPIDKLMYAGMCEDAVLKNAFEKKMAEKFKKTKTEAISSKVCFPNIEQLSRKTIAAELKRLGVDGILITWLMEIKEKKTERTTFQPDFKYRPGRNFYRDETFRIINRINEENKYRNVRRKRVYKDRYVLVDSKLFEAERGALIWHIQTETVNPGALEDIIDALGDAIIKNLKKNKLIR